MMVQTGFIWLRVRASDGLFKRGNETFGIHNSKKICSPVLQSSDCQECSAQMNLFNHAVHLQLLLECRTN